MFHSQKNTQKISAFGPNMCFRANHKLSRSSERNQCFHHHHHCCFNSEPKVFDASHVQSTHSELPQTKYHLLQKLYTSCCHILWSCVTGVTFSAPQSYILPDWSWHHTLRCFWLCWFCLFLGWNLNRCMTIRLDFICKQMVAISWELAAVAQFSSTLSNLLSWQSAAEKIKQIQEKYAEASLYTFVSCQLPDI